MSWAIGAASGHPMGDGGFWNLLPSLNLVLWSNSPSFKFWVTCWEGYLFPLSQSSTSAVLRTISIHATLYCTSQVPIPVGPLPPPSSWIPLFALTSRLDITELCSVQCCMPWGTIQYSAKILRLDCVIPHPGSLWHWGKFTSPSIRLLAEYCIRAIHEPGKSLIVQPSTHKPIRSWCTCTSRAPDGGRINILLEILNHNS